MSTTILTPLKLEKSLMIWLNYSSMLFFVVVFAVYLNFFY